MMEHTFPLGSVVRVRGMNALIAGYSWEDDDGRPLFEYLIVPYPLGYTSTDCVKRATAEELTLISAGYQDTYSATYCRNLDGLRMVAADYTTDELIACLEDATKRLEEEK